MMKCAIYYCYVFVFTIHQSLFCICVDLCDDIQRNILKCNLKSRCNHVLNVYKKMYI